MFTLLLGVLEQSLKAWNSHEKNKYIDRVISIKKEWNEEYAKPSDVISHNRLDELESELRIIAESFISSFGNENSGN